MNVDTDVFAALTERADAVGRLEDAVAELAVRVEHAIEWGAMLRRAAMPAAAMVHGTRTGRPKHAAARDRRGLRAIDGGQAVTGQAGQAPGVVKVRLSGDPKDVAAVTELLAGIQGTAVAGRVALLTPGGHAAQFPAVEILDQSAPRPNRRDPGERVYLTLRIGEPEGSQS